MLAEQEQRRQLVKEMSVQMTLANEKPFSFYKKYEKRAQTPPARHPDFVATEVPAHTYERLYEKMCYDDAIERHERVAQRAHANLAQSSLPPRMQLYEDSKRARSASPKRKPEKYVFHASEVPDFEALQAEFAQKIEQGKQKRQNTIPEPFNFAPTRPQTAGADLNRQKAKWGKPKKAKRAPKFKKPAYVPNTTAKFRDWVAINQQRQNEKYEKERAKEDEEIAREQRQEMMKARLNACPIVKDRKIQLKHEREKTLKQKRAEQKRKEKEYKERLAEINSRVCRRPLLVEQVYYSKDSISLMSNSVESAN